MPRPAGAEAEGRTGHVGEHVANVSRSVRYEELVHFIADRDDGCPQHEDLVNDAATMGTTIQPQRSQRPQRLFETCGPLWLSLCGHGGDPVTAGADTAATRWRRRQR
jgi:hypothetical protein